jgi:nicotinamidase-related amidase
MNHAFDERPIPADAIHLCLDMQLLFREGPWAVPSFDRVLPAVERLVAARPAATIFSRFQPPARPEQATGNWRRYYERWAQVTTEQLDPRLLELTPELAGYAPPALKFSKSAYSPFHGTALDEVLRARSATTLIVSGTETDVCVLAAVLDAVDFGYRVVVARDAVCSSNDGTHDALMKLYHERFSQQVDVADVGEILAHWPS